jgi:hypothetical protein
MTITGREKAMAAITVMVLMYGVLGLLAKGRLESWRVKRGEGDLLARRLAQEQALIESRPQLEKKYAGVRNLMPVFSAHEPVDTRWQSIMEEVAAHNGINISNRKPIQENLVGDVYETVIEVTEWNGSLDQLIHFLYELETKGVMFDMRKISIRPHPQNRLLLRGSFTLYCAYMREKPTASGVTAKPGAVVAKPAANTVKAKPATPSAGVAKPVTSKPPSATGAAKPLPLPPPPKKK